VLPDAPLQDVVLRRLVYGLVAEGCLFYRDPVHCNFVVQKLRIGRDIAAGVCSHVVRRESAVNDDDMYVRQRYRLLISEEFCLTQRVSEDKNTYSLVTNQRCLLLVAPLLCQHSVCYFCRVDCLSSHIFVLSCRSGQFVVIVEERGDVLTTSWLVFYRHECIQQ